MRPHPELHVVTVTCLNCGTEHTLQSSSPTLPNLEVCSACHPAYTGTPGVVRRRSDRIEKFERRRALARKEGA